MIRRSTKAKVPEEKVIRMPPRVDFGSQDSLFGYRLHFELQKYHAIIFKTF